jgi:hypothetical protein
MSFMRQPSAAKQNEAIGGRLPLALPTHVAKGCFGFRHLIEPFFAGEGAAALHAATLHS